MDSQRRDRGGLSLTLLLMGTLCLTAAEELVGTALGFGIFWVARLFVQFFGYSSRLWRHKRFEAAVHVVFSFLWFYFSFVFPGVYWLR